MGGEALYVGCQSARRIVGLKNGEFDEPCPSFRGLFGDAVLNLVYDLEKSEGLLSRTTELLPTYVVSM